jgi:hypothetical protein
MSAKIHMLPAIGVCKDNVIERFSVAEEFGLIDPGS